jgi:acetyltransferase
VVKVCSGEIIHKTEHNGVILGVHEDAVEEAAAGIRGSFPGSPVLIEEMVSYGGFEFILGVLEDAGFGPAVMAGAGGILTELYQDVAFRLAPCSAREARRMLEELRIFPVLSGYRNINMDHRGLADIIVKLADFSLVYSPGGRQLDINPIVWDGSGWVVLDAKAVMP